MSAWIKRIGIALAVLLLVAIAAAVYLVSTFDPNRYKGMAVDWMKANRNRTLVIDGPIELSVFPRVAVKLSRLSLSEAGRSEQFAAIDSAALAVDVMPLLSGRVVVGRVEASGVRAQLLRDAQGRRNTDDLAGPAAPASAPSKTEPKSAAGKPLDFDIDRVTLKDVRARVKDDQGGIDGELVLDSLSTGRIANGVESAIELAAKFDFRKPVLKGSLDGKTRLTPDLATGSVRLADMNLTFKGDVPGASAVETNVRGALAYDGAKGSVDAKGLELQLAARAGAIQVAGSTLSIGAFGYDPTKQALRVEQLKLRVKGSRGKDPLALDLDWPQLDVEGQKLKGSPLEGKLDLGGELPVNATFKSGAPTGTFDAVALPAFEAKLSSNSAARKLDGTLRANLGIKPAKSAISLEALALQANVEDKGLKPVALSLKGSASASPQAAQWAVSGQVNTNNFAIDGNANLSASPLFVKANARFDALDLNTLLPAGASAGATPDKNAPAPADAPVDLSALRALNANVSLRAGSFVFRQYRIADARIEAQLDNGMLKVPVLQAKAWGGALDANALADARANRIAVKAVATGVNVNALLKDVAGKDLLEGTGRVAMDVDTTGKSIGELRSHLRGTASLNLRDGAIKGINLAKSMRQAKAALSLKDDASTKAVQTEKTDFSELSASFQIADGVARSSDLDLKSPYLRLGGDGAVDIGKGRIDYTARATVTGTAAGQGGAELAALKGVTVPVRLTGPFEAIEWKIQWSAVAAGAVQNKLEDKLRDKLGLKAPAGGASAAAGAASAPTPKQQLKEKLLKGLFK
ncbi:AsmA family protein [Rhizobacter sp. AJA081-3]|uniref:AsmA family protein n=1 Tax=Rhizobacter sp. AJA081-3 TaxID=2753607 RepID=UPI001ADF396C|nr:AsmA family protein [Rhizobacter sp. AJA081-3]QTN24224.1 AsmA family protein [Rhizobacter sp. AJA081-3]